MCSLLLYHCIHTQELISFARGFPGQSSHSQTYLLDEHLSEKRYLFSYKETHAARSQRPYLFFNTSVAVRIILADASDIPPQRSINRKFANLRFDLAY